MQDLKLIFNRAAKNVATRAATDWTMNQDDTWDGTEGVFEKKKSPWEKIKEAYQKTAQEAASGKFYNTYLNTLNMLQKQKKTLPGKIAIGMESPRTYGGQAPGRSKVATDTYREKLGEVQSRMRRFATEKYYAGIGGYGKS